MSRMKWIVRGHLFLWPSNLWDSVGLISVAATGLFAVDVEGLLNVEDTARPIQLDLESLMEVSSGRSWNDDINRD